MKMVRSICAAVLAAGLVAFPLAQSRAADEVPVTISVRASVDAGILHIRGNATVPDRAWIIYAAYGGAEPQRRPTGYARVKDEHFAAQLDVSAWPPGEITVDAHFQVSLPAREQPDAVVARFGPNGERMTGDNVVEGGASFRAAVASTTVVKP